MKVKMKSMDNPLFSKFAELGQEAESWRNDFADREHSVCGVDWLDGKLWFIVSPDEYAPMPYSIPSVFFDISDPRIPVNWVLMRRGRSTSVENNAPHSETLYLGPKELADGSFQSNVLDQEPEAVARFKKMMASSQVHED